MRQPMIRTVSLVPRGGPGLACDGDGLALGPVALATRISDSTGRQRYELISSNEMAATFRLAYGPVSDAFIVRRCAGVARVTQLLGMDEDALARIYAVLLDFPEIPREGMAKLAATSIKKSGSDDWEDEARVPAGNPGAGEWTSDGSGAPPAAVSSELAVPVSTVAGAVAADSLFGEIGPAAVAGLEALGASFAAATAFLGVIFIPTNKPTSSTGILPGHPDIDYRLDEDTGNLQLYRNGEVLFDGHRGPDGLFHAADGGVIGRQVDGSIVLDPDSLLGYASQAASEKPDNAAQSQAQSRADGDQPKLCPDWTKDRPGNKSPDALAYQQQITHIPIGLAVELNGVMYDGCDERTGDMIETKGNYIWTMDGPDRLYDWFTGDESIMDQAQRQSNAAAAAGRRVEWYFADRPVADYYRARFAEAGLGNITVIHMPYTGGGR